MSQLKYIRPEKLAEMVGDENVAEMLLSYRDSLHRSLKELELSCQQQRLEDVHLLAHKMKSSTRLVGADLLADEFQDLEHKTLDQANVDCDIENLLQRIAEHVARVEQDIDNYLQPSA